MKKSKFFDTDWIDVQIEGMRDLGIEINQKEADHIRAIKTNSMIVAFAYCLEEEKDDRTS